MGKGRLLVWLHFNCYGSNEQMCCSLFKGDQARSAVVSHETTLCSTKDTLQRLTCWPLGDIWNYSFRSKAYCSCLYLESKSGVLHFIKLWFNKTCWKMHMSYFENDYGNVGSKEINHPKLAHLLYEYRPLIDEHNKQRKKNLGLERKWPTCNCWVHLMTTLMGMCIVDMHRSYHNILHGRYLDIGEKKNRYRFFYIWWQL